MYSSKSFLRANSTVRNKSVRRGTVQGMEQIRLSKLKQQYKALPMAAKVSFWFFFCNAMQKSLSMLTVPIVTRMLTAEEYGVYSVFNAYAEIMVILGTLRLFGQGYFVGMKHYQQDKQRYTAAIGGLMIVITGALLVIYCLFSKQVTQWSGLHPVLWGLMFLWVFSQGAIGLWFVENRYEFRYRQIVAGTMGIALSTPVLKITLIICCKHSGIDPALGAVLGLVLPYAAVALIAWWYVFSKGKTFYIKEYWCFAVSFNLPIIPFYLSQSILNQADRIMIERMVSSAAAGIYSVAYTMAMTISVLNSALDSSLAPWQFKKMQKGAFPDVRRILNILMPALAAVHLLFIAVAPEIMILFASNEYAPAIYVIPPVTMGILFQWIAQLFINVEMFYEQNWLASTTSVLAATINVLLNAFAIPRFGYLAAGYTTLICCFANMVFHGFAVARRLRGAEQGKLFDYRKISLLAAGCLAAMLLMTGSYPYPLIRWGLLLAGGIATVQKREKIKQLVNNIKGDLHHE